MFCNNCGVAIADNSKFCSNCGNKCAVDPRIKTIRMRCRNCSGVMEITPDRTEVFCPFCGEKEAVLDSDIVAVEKIRSDVNKEIELAKLDRQYKIEERNERKKAQQEYKRRKLSKVTIALTFICLFVAFTSFSSGHFLSGIIAAVQTVLFAVSWLMGMQIIKEKHSNLHVGIAVLGFLLIIPFFAGNRIKISSKLEWPNEGMAALLPNPNSKYGEVSVDTGQTLMIDVDKYSTEDYNRYVSDCKDKGFTIDSKSTTYSYEAYNSEGYELRLSYFSSDKSMDITLNEPLSMSEIKWPSSEIGQLIPIPDSNYGKIQRESPDSFYIYIGNTTEEKYNDYVELCRSAGFDVDYSKGEGYYRAEDSIGNKLSLSYEGNNTFSVSMDKAEETDDIADVEEAEEPEADNETSDAGDTFVTEVVEEEPIEEESAEETETTSGGVNPDLKATLDAYESFMDNYIAFMTSFNESNDTASMLTEYTSFMSEYARYMETIEKYDTSEMSNADTAYYLEVTGRVTQKLLNASF